MEEKEIGLGEKTELAKNTFLAYDYNLPLLKGTRLFLFFDRFDSVPSIVEVLQSSEDGLKCYIHYVNCNRRLDRWVDLYLLRPLQSVRVFDSSFINPTAFATAARLPLSTLQPLSVQPEKRPGLAHALGARRYATRQSFARLQLANEEPNSNYEKLYQDRSAVKNVREVVFDKLLFDCWYFSPFPLPKPSYDRLYFCAKCFFYCQSAPGLSLHEANCALAAPPGKCVYNDSEGGVRVFEVDGSLAKVYCQCLCLFGKLFLERKTLFYEVGLFRFYVAVYEDDGNSHVMGFFSKEKHSFDHNNLSCIVVFPHWQRKGVGRFLVELSYAISRKEKVVSGPENPISDLGRLLYNAFWTEEVLKGLLELEKNVCVPELSDFVMIPELYVISVLDALDLLRYFKGQYVVPFERKVLKRYYKFYCKDKKMPFFKKCFKLF